MVTTDIGRKLYKLNPRLHIFFGSDPNKPAGVYVRRGEIQYEEVCGIDKNDVPEFTTWYPSGRIAKGGWRRVLQILVGMHLIDKRKSFKYFGRWDEHRQPPFQAPETQIQQAIKYAAERESWKSDDIVDVGRLIEKEKPTCLPQP